jgi:hypothetical protein
MPNIDYAIESFRTTSRGLGSDDLDTLRRYGQSGWKSITPSPTARTGTTFCSCSSA